jgi:type I restriction enzyme S subunit
MFDGVHGTPKPAKGGPIFLGIRNLMDDGHFDLTDIRHIQEEDFPRWTKRVEPQAGDIVFSYEATLNLYGIIPDGFRGCLGRRLALIRPNPEKVDTRFLFYYFFGSEWRATIQKNILEGATVQRIPISGFPEFPVTIPPLESQRRIASILSAYDDLIENNTRRIKILEEMAKLIYREWFVEFKAPGVKLRKATAEEKKTTGKDVFPEGWELRRYSDEIESFQGGDWGGEEATEGEGSPVIIIRGTDFEDIRWGNQLRTPRRFISETSMQKRRLRKGDIIVENSVNAKSRCVGTSLYIAEGIVRRLSDDFVAASFCKVFRFKQPTLAPLFLMHMKDLYVTNRMNFYQNVAANGIGNFQATRFIETESVPMPVDSTKLNGLADFFSGLTESTLSDTNYNLRQTRDLLLPKLVNGEVEV